MTSTRGSASSCCLSAFFIATPALSAPIATIYRSFAIAQSLPYTCPGPALPREPGTERVQDVVDRRRPSILNTPRALAQARGAATAADHVDGREHPGRRRGESRGPGLGKLHSFCRRLI